jgi:hypothetical protein
MKKLPIVLALVLIQAFAFAAQAQTKKSSTIKDVDFSNFSYRVVFDDPKNEKTIKLAGGELTDSDAGNTYSLFDKPVYADINGDKSEDAVVEIKLDSTGSYRDFEVHAYTFRNGAAKMLARITAGQVTKDYKKYYPKNALLHYAGVNPPKIQNRLVTVEALTDGSFACPKYTAIFNYKLSGGKFILSGKPMRKPFVCN